MSTSPTATPVNGLGQAANISDKWRFDMPESYGMNGAAHLAFVVECWSVLAFDQEPNMPLDDYYLVAVTGTLAMNLNSTLYTDSYSITTTPALAGATLIDSSPETTSGQSSTTSEITNTISAEAVFGEDPSASIGSSVSLMNAKEISLPSIVCLNKSQDAGENGHWIFQLAQETPAQGADFQFTNQMLWQVPRQDGVPVLSVTTAVSVGVSDHDGSHGTNNFDSFHNAIEPNLQAINAKFVYTNDRIARIDFAPRPTALTRSPAPAPAPAVA
jgi:hypothetical protein